MISDDALELTQKNKITYVITALHRKLNVK